jgi:hypothetical protein
MIITVEIIEHLNVVEVVINTDDDQDPVIDRQNIIVHLDHVHVIDDIINVHVHGKLFDGK